jgi:hypothetical protein
MYRGRSEKNIRDEERNSGPTVCNEHPSLQAVNKSEIDLRFGVFMVVTMENGVF